MSLLRLVSAFLASLAACAALAAPLSQRSPFVQGHWWNPERSGSGFQIFNTADQVAVVWYTFEEGEKPVWYTAQGDRAGLGHDTWPLVRHRWVNGARVGQQVGMVRLTVQHFEALSLDWNMGVKQGSWNLKPLRASGVMSDVDHTGSWFDASNSGWGLTLTEQGEVLGGVLFTYDAAGDPTWVAGFGRDVGRIQLYAASGACPWCVYGRTTTRSVGALAVEFNGETRMTVRNGLDVAMAPGVRIDGAQLQQLSPPASTRPADRALANFDSAEALKAYFDLGIMNLGARAYGNDFSASPPTPTAATASSFSTTNLQEAGVDEADLVKNDGRFIYALTGRYYGASASIRIAEVLDGGRRIQVRGSVPLAADTYVSSQASGLYLHDGRLVAVTSSYQYGPMLTAAVWVGGSTRIEMLSTNTSGMPAPVWRADIEGYLVASRRIGDRLYVVSRYAPSLPAFSYGATSPAAIAANRALLANTPLETFMPKVRFNAGAPTLAVEPSQVYLAPQGESGSIASMVIVTAIDLRTPSVAQSLAVLGGAEAVYVSTDNLYVATSRYQLRDYNGLALPEPSFYLTDIHKIQLGATQMSVAGSGTAEGYLASSGDKAVFRMSEHQGRMRVVTSSGQMWGGSIQNRLTVLEPSTVTPGLLRTAGYLPNERRPESLGKPGELLYGTRFVNERLYAVTFKMIDPLYVVDIANPSDPRIAGALEMPGFSEYLHPLPNGLLLGFGKDARPALTMGDGSFAWYQGLQLSLFDVSDAGRPRELQRVLMGKRGSTSALLQDHHAFTELVRSAGQREISFPAKIHDADYPQYGGGDSAFYPFKESGLMRFELRGSTPADARLITLPMLVTSRATGPFISDDSEYGGRSVLFGQGAVYVGNGNFWHQDSAGNASGPY